MRLRRWHLFFALPLFLLLLLLPPTLLLAQFVIEKEITLVADGQVLQLNSRAGLVTQLLREQGIILQPGDHVEPAATSLLHSGRQVRVSRARDIVLGVDGVTRVLRSWRTDPAAILAEARVLAAAADTLYVNGQRVDPQQPYSPDLPLTRLELWRPRSFRLQDDATSQTLRSSVRSVGEALAEAGISLHAADEVQPSVETTLAAGMTVQINRATELTIVADGASLQTRVQGASVADALAAAGLQLTDLDYSIPPGAAALLPGMLLRVIRVHEEVEYQREVLPHRTVSQADPELELDRRRVLQQGQDGVRGLPQRVRYENGVEISRVAGEPELLQEARDHVIGLGSKIVLRSVNTPQGPRQYWRVLRMKATSYHPGSQGNSTATATGAVLRKGIVASNPKVIPYGTEVYVEGYGVGSMEDTAAAWYVQQQPLFIDLGYSDADYQPWSKWVDVYLLTPVPHGRFPLVLPG